MHVLALKTTRLSGVSRATSKPRRRHRKRGERRRSAADLDAVVGTKIYDLSPYFQEMGPRGSIRQPAWPGDMLTGYWADQA